MLQFSSLLRALAVLTCKAETYAQLRLQMLAAPTAVTAEARPVPSIHEYMPGFL
jgi:hypothetical protein